MAETLQDHVVALEEILFDNGPTSRDVLPNICEMEGRCTAIPAGWVALLMREALTPIIATIFLTLGFVSPFLDRTSG